MQISDFSRVSMNGRMAYLILCIEKYLCEKYPSKNWIPLSKLLWKSTSSYWDDWDFEYIEVIPEFLFANKSFEESDFEYLSKHDYSLFTELLKGMPEEINQLLLAPHKLQEIYCYSSIPGNGDEASQIVIDACNILIKNKIELPNIETVIFSNFNEKDGWGERFDGCKLSLVLCNKY